MQIRPKNKSFRKQKQKYQSNQEENNMNKEKNKLILSWLRQNARITLTKLSKKTRIPISTLHDHIKAEQKKGIYRHVTIINFAQLGYNTKAQVLIKCKEKKSEFEEHLQQQNYVNSFYRINNDYDFLAECVAKNMKELESHLDKLNEQYSIETKVHFVIDEIKKEKFLSQPELLAIN